MVYTYDTSYGGPNDGPLMYPRSIIYQTNQSTGSRKAIGILYGPTEKRKKSALWLSGGNTSIEVVEKQSIYHLYEDEKLVNSGEHRNQYIVHNNMPEILLGFCGEDENVYTYRLKASVVIDAKAIFKTPGLSKYSTIDGKNVMYLKGISVMVIRDGICLIECITGKLSIQGMEPIPYAGEVPNSFVTEQEIQNYLELTQPQTSQQSTQTEAPVTHEDSDSSGPFGNIRARLIRLAQRIKGYKVIAVTDDNLRVANSWDDLVN